MNCQILFEVATTNQKNTCQSWIYICSNRNKKSWSGERDWRNARKINFAFFGQFSHQHGLLLFQRSNAKTKRWAQNHTPAPTPPPAIRPPWWLWCILFDSFFFVKQPSQSTRQINLANVLQIKNARHLSPRLMCCRPPLGNEARPVLDPCSWIGSSGVGKESRKSLQDTKNNCGRRCRNPPPPCMMACSNLAGGSLRVPSPSRWSAAGMFCRLMRSRSCKTEIPQQYFEYLKPLYTSAVAEIATAIPILNVSLPHNTQ